ncbi:MAG: hypothetical protein IPN51_12875 [Chloracidobacterium sp.]|nr:hypothetical protein [Chloracidobacterium sp.]
MLKRYENADLAYAVSDNASDKDLLCEMVKIQLPFRTLIQSEFWQRLGIETLDVSNEIFLTILLADNILSGVPAESY